MFKAARRLTIATVAAGLIAGAFAFAAPAVAAPADGIPVPVSPADQAKLHAYWDRYGISAKTQRTLLAKIESGQVLDSDNGSSPVSESTTTSGDTTTTIDTFADGSIAVIGVGPVAPAATGGVHTDSVGSASCHVTSYSGPTTYYACAVSGSTSTLSLAYNGYYWYNGVSGTSAITSVASLQYSCILGTCSSPYLHVTRTYDQPSLSALAEGGATWNGYGGIGTYNEWLRFFVHNGAASAQYN